MSIENKQDAAEPSPASAGSVAGEPVAWEVFLPGVGTYGIHSFRWEAAAIAHALLSNEGTIAAVCPLYRQPQPTLTDAEREAVNDAICLCGAEAGLAGEQANATAWATCAATLRGLLERTGGGR